MTVFEIVSNEIEIRRKDKALIKPGCTEMQDEYFPEKLKQFNNKEDAIAALEGYESTITEVSTPIGTVYHVMEFYVQENTYNNDGEWISGGDIWSFSKMDTSCLEDEE